MPISKFKMNSVERFVGVVVKVMPSRYVKKRETRVASIEIADETGSLVLSLWGTKADSHGLLAGDVVFFRGVWIKSNTYNGRMQASLAREGYFRVLFKFHTKTWCSDADENIKCRAKRVLDGVSKRYPQLLRESQFTESSIRKIMNTTDSNTPKNDRLSNFISVDVVILSLKHDKDVLVVTARGGFVRDVEVVIRYFKYSKSLKTKLNGMMRSETRCTVTNLCLNNTIEPKTYGVCAILDQTKDTQIEVEDNQSNQKPQSLMKWLEQLNTRSSRPLTGKIRASVSNVYFPSLARHDETELNFENLTMLLTRDGREFEPFKIALTDHDVPRSVWVYVPSHWASHLLGSQTIEDVTKRKEHASSVILNTVHGLVNMYKNGEQVDVVLRAYFQGGDDTDDISWHDYDLELREVRCVVAV